MTHSWDDVFVKHGSLLGRHNECVWLMRMCNMTNSYVWHYSFISATRLIPETTYLLTMAHCYDDTTNAYDSCVCVTWLIHMCDITHSYVRHDSFIYVTWHMRDFGMTRSCVRHYSCTCATWIVYMCESCVYATWLIHVCDMTHSYVWHDSFIRVTWLIHMWDMTHSWRIQMCDMTHSSCVTWLGHMCNMTQTLHHNDVLPMGTRYTMPIKSYHTHEWVMSHIWLCHLTHMNGLRHTYEWVMSNTPSTLYCS